MFYIKNDCIVDVFINYLFLLQSYKENASFLTDNILHVFTDVSNVCLCKSEKKKNCENVWKNRSFEMTQWGFEGGWVCQVFGGRQHPSVLHARLTLTSAEITLDLSLSVRRGGWVIPKSRRSKFSGRCIIHNTLNPTLIQTFGTSEASVGNKCTQSIGFIVER